MAQEAKTTPESNESRITKLARGFMRQSGLIEADAQLKIHNDVDMDIDDAAQASVEFAMSIRASRALAGFMNFVS